MRLIDADELIKSYLDRCRIVIKGERIIDENVIAIIQNAPTVCNDNYAMGYQDGVKKVLSESPQGEWIDTGDMNEYWAEEYQCSICGTKNHWHNYCPNCGAEMRGGAE